MSKALWQAVLLRTVEDALIGVANESSRTNRVRMCEEARRYLTRPSADLAEVCFLAGFDPKAVVEQMRARIAEAPTPEELADNPRQSAATFTKAPAKPKAKRIAFEDQRFTINGVARTAAEWCERTGVELKLVKSRLRDAWEPERAFTLTRQEAREEALEKARASYQVVIARQNATRRKRAESPSTPRYEHNGENLTLKEWSERTGIKKGTLYKRIVLSGWSVAEAIKTPIQRNAECAITTSHSTNRL